MGARKPAKACGRPRSFPSRAKALTGRAGETPLAGDATLSCQVCKECGKSHWRGTESLHKSTKNELVYDNLCGSKLVEKTYYHCDTCGEEGDFFNDNDGVITVALDELKRNFVEQTLEGFTRNRISLSSMERALELPQRTLTKWKNNASSPTATGIALLKFLRLFPWLLEVAEGGYDYESSQKIFMMTAFNTMVKKMSFFEGEYREAGIFSNANSAFFYIRVQKKADEAQVASSPMIFIS